MINEKLKKIVLSTALCTTLAACGGGGAGGGADTINDFVQDDLSNLSGSSSIISSYSSLLSIFQSTISSGNYSSLSAILTGPDADDIATANTLLTMLTQAETLWSQTEDLIANVDDEIDLDGNITKSADQIKYDIYNSDSYKEAYAAMLYLNDHVKPVIQKVSNGNTVTQDEFNIVAKSDRAQEIINEEKVGTASTYAETKKIKSTETVSNDSNSYVDTVGEAESTTSSGEWETVNAGGGQETRTLTTTIPNYRTTTTQNCTFSRKILLNGDVIDGAQTCTITDTTTSTLDPTITTATETREGDNPVITSETLDALVNTVTETSNEYVVTNYADAEDTNTTTTNGTAVTTTANRDIVTDVDNGNNTTTRTTVRYVDTTITTPVTTTVTRTRTYTDITRQNSRTVTTTTPQTKVTYKDGTSETISDTAVVVTGDWQISQISTATRTEEMPVSETTANTVSTTSDSGTPIAQITIENAYTDDDNTLGTQTTGLSTTANDFKTTEYNKGGGLDLINAAEAYAKGWTGKGAVLGVIDTYQDQNHSALSNKYKWYNDYTLHDSTVTDSGNLVSHGTHVAGIVAGKRDGNEFHGVAFDADLVGANVDYHGNGGINKGKAQEALHDFAKLKNPDGENLNIVAVNMSWNTPNMFTNGSASTVTALNDGTYNALEITTRMDHHDGQAKYYKIATDNDMILVNSAGNGLWIDNSYMMYDYVIDPGIWATEVYTQFDADNNLITSGKSVGDLKLSGKMIIVGSWDGTQIQGNKAGHICLNINLANNTCNDTFKVKDFYILAPGQIGNQGIYSSVPQNGYLRDSGTSMAAPHVTGAFGIINQMWPHMKGDNLVKLILSTADKDITGYNVNTHGQGLLDLNEATKPQGATGIVTTGRTNGPIIDVYGTYFATGTSLPSNLANLKVMVLDNYERDYYVNLGSSFTVSDNRKLSDINSMMNGFTYLPVQSMYGTFAQGGNYDLGFMNFGLYSGENGNGDFSANIGKHFDLSKNLKLKTSIGQMNEETSWLGNQSDGILSTGGDNTTNFGQIGVEYNLGNNILSVDYSRGNTSVNTTDNSLITGFSDIKTESFKVGYEIKKDDNNSFGFTASIPSHVTDGTMDLTVPESRTLDGQINYTNIKSDMSSDTVEKDVGFYFKHTPKNEMDASFNFSAEYRQDISGQNGHDGVALGFNYVKKLNTNCKFLWMKNPKCYHKDGSKKSYAQLYNYDKTTDVSTALALGLIDNASVDDWDADK